jgi:hypothetical protein
MTEKSDFPLVPFQAVAVSATDPPLAARVFAVTAVGTADTETVTDSFNANPTVVESFDVTSTRTSADGELDPTTVSDVCPLGPTYAATDCEICADAGATDERRPKPKAATVTSATRLKVVFVDICFLSISRAREFPALGLKLIS